MNAYQEIKSDISKLITNGLKLGLIVNPRASDRIFHGNRISSGYTFFDDEKEYIEKRRESYEKDLFLFALKDGAILQLNYEFDINKKVSTISKINIAYLPALDDSDKPLSSNYIRVDYDPGNKSNSIFHESTHAHIGFYSTPRIALSKIVRPSEFFELILFLFYPGDFTIWTKRNIPSGKYQTEKLGAKELTKNKACSEWIQKFFHIENNI